MKLTLYMFRDTVVEFDDAFPPEKRSGEGGYIELMPTGALPYEARVYIQPGKKSHPEWLSFLDERFEVDHLDLYNVSTSLVILIRVEGRIFAITKGYGFASIDRTLVEPGFGIRTTLNEVDPAQLRQVRSRRVTSSPRETQVYQAKSSTLGEFGLDIDTELLRHVSGRARESQFGKTLAGTDSLSASPDVGFDDLPGLCGNALVSFEKTDYRNDFGFFDRVAQVKSPELTRLLNQELLGRWQRGEPGILYACPGLEYLAAEEICLRYRKTCERVDDINSDAISSFIGRANQPLSPQDIEVRATNESGGAVASPRSLWDFLISELHYKDRVFVHDLGQWFEVAPDYASDTNKRVDDTTLLSTEQLCGLPPWPPGTSEGQYNELAAESPGIWLMDKALFREPGRQIEVCDLLSEQGHLICVKRGGRSSSLSHLFSQGSVSAAHLADDKFCSHIRNMCPEGWASITDGNGVLRRDAITVVYGIGVTQPGKLSAVLPFFSRVNLLSHSRRVREMGCKVAVCQIPSQ